jgi:hypothetical protein
VDVAYNSNGRRDVWDVAFVGENVLRGFTQPLHFLLCQVLALLHTFDLLVIISNLWI